MKESDERVGKQKKNVFKKGRYGPENDQKTPIYKVFFTFFKFSNFECSLVFLDFEV